MGAGAVVPKAFICKIGELIMFTATIAGSAGKFIKQMERQH
jgi:hypothetical protein